MLDELLNELRAYMKRNKITQEEMARQLGITRPQFNRILNGKSGTTVRVMESVYHILGKEKPNRIGPRLVITALGEWVYEWEDGTLTKTPERKM